MARPITALLHSFIAEKSCWRAHLLRDWNSIVGALHTRMCLEKIHEDGTLIIGVHDSRWMHELFYLSQEIIQTINAQLGQPHVMRIRLILSNTKHSPSHRARKRRAATPAPPPTPAPAAHTRPLTPREQQALQRIEDPQLQEILSQIMQRR